MDGNDTVPKKVKHELHLLATKQGIPNYNIKIRTITSSVDATLKYSIVRYPEIQRRLHGNAKVLGVLRKLLSVYLSSLVDNENLCTFATDLIFGPGVLYHLCMRLTGSTMRAANERSPRKLD